jgi:hypothetical protein
LTLERPFVRGDSVLGQTGRDTTGLALTEIDTVSVKRFDWAKTIGLVAVTSAAGMAVSALVLSDLGEIGFTFSE